MEKTGLKNAGSVFYGLFALLFAVWLVVFAAEAREAAAEALIICRDVILTTVLPFSVASDLLVCSGFCETVGRVAGRPLSRLFGISETGAGVFVLGLFGGYPSGAYAVSELCSAGRIGRSEAEVLISYTNNATPAFAAVYVGSLLGSARAGVLCCLSVIFSAVLFGLIIRKKAGSPVCVNEGSPHRFSLPRSVSAGASGAVVICANVIVFRVISKALSALPLGGFLSAIPEITSGAAVLASAVSDPRLSASLVCSLVSFSGLSVASQVSAAVSECGIRMRYYVTGKIFQAAASFFAVYLLYPIFFS